MSDLINRQEAISVTWNALNVGDACHELKALPSAQPEIIYCKDCAYRCENWISTNVDGDVIHHCTQLGQMVDDDFYCGCAERGNDE